MVCDKEGLVLLAYSPWLPNVPANASVAAIDDARNNIAVNAGDYTANDFAAKDHTSNDYTSDNTHFGTADKPGNAGDDAANDPSSAHKSTNICDPTTPSSYNGDIVAACIRVTHPSTWYYPANPDDNIHSCEDH